MTWDIKDAGDDTNLAILKPKACNIEIDIKDSLSSNFFKYVFLSIKGHTKLMDTFLSNEKVTYYYTAKNRKIIFFDADPDNLDHIIKQYYLLAVTAAIELENGTENLWKRESSSGRRMHRDVRKFIYKEVFKCFYSIALCM